MNLKELSSKKLSSAVFLTSFLIYVLLASGLVSSPHPLTGDEPHYILISNSILHDGDINLFNNYQDKDYLKYYPGQLSSHASPGKRGTEHQFSKHAPGLPVLLLPFYFIGEKLSAIIFMVRIPICLFTALLSLAFFLLVQDFVKNRYISLLSWSIFSFCSPVLFYSHLVYPEVPAALILVLIFKHAHNKRENTSAFFLFTGLGLAFLPWMGVKYAALSVVVFAVIVFPLLKSIKKNLRQVVLLASTPIISAFLYLFYLWSLYRNFSPLSIYRGVMPDQNLNPTLTMNSSLSEIVSTGLGFFFDQRIGIFIYTPIYILFIAGIYFAAKRIQNGAYPLLIVFMSYWIFCSLFPYWWGYCPPGRSLLTIIWIAALFVAIALAENKNRLSGIIRNLWIVQSFIVVYLGVRDPMLLYHENLANPSNETGTYSHLLSTWSNVFIDFRKLVPSLVGERNIRWLTLNLWICVVLFITIMIVKSQKKKTQGKQSSQKYGVITAAVIIFSMLFLGYQFFDIQLENRAPFADKHYELIFQDTNHYGKELGGFWTKGDRKTNLLIRSEMPLEEIQMNLSSPVAGVTAVQVDRFKEKILRDHKTGLERKITVRSPVGFPWKGSYLYSVQLSESNPFIPYELNKKIPDNRSLGIFAKITTKSVSYSMGRITK